MTDLGKPAGLPRRLLQLHAGLLLYGLGMALMIEARLGLDPWDVFHQGLARRTGLRFGWVVIGVGALVLLAWIPLRQLPGVGTVCNVVVIGLAVDEAIDLLPTPHPLALRAAYLVAGVLVGGLATGLYIGARLGPGPRDGLMTGAVARYGGSIRLVRTAIEVTVLAAGWLLGGSVGIGTLLYAVAIGPLAHFLIPRLSVRTVRQQPGEDAGQHDGSAQHVGQVHRLAEQQRAGRDRAHRREHGERRHPARAVPSQQRRPDAEAEQRGDPRDIPDGEAAGRVQRERGQVPARALDQQGEREVHGRGDGADPHHEPHRIQPAARPG